MTFGIRSFPIGTEAIMILAITFLIVLLYLGATILTHIKVIRLSAAEATLMTMFSSTLTLMIGLLIGGEDALAFYVFIFFLIFTVILFSKKANRWYIEREIKRSTGETVQKEKKDSGM